MAEKIPDVPSTAEKTPKFKIVACTEKQADEHFAKFRVAADTSPSDSKELRRLTKAVKQHGFGALQISSRANIQTWIKTRLKPSQNLALAEFALVRVRGLAPTIINWWRKALASVGQDAYLVCQFPDVANALLAYEEGTCAGLMTRAEVLQLLQEHHLTQHIPMLPTTSVDRVHVVFLIQRQPLKPDQGSVSWLSAAREKKWLAGEPVRMISAGGIDGHKVTVTQGTVPNGCKNSAICFYECKNTDGVFKPAFRCKRCLVGSYCSTACQTKHWPTHKQACTAPTISLSTHATTAPSSAVANVTAPPAPAVAAAPTNVIAAPSRVVSNKPFVNAMPSACPNHQACTGGSVPPTTTFESTTVPTGSPTMSSDVTSCS